MGFYKDALYANRDVARRLTGAVRLAFSGPHGTVHVQLVRGQAPEPALERGLLQAMTANVGPVRLVLWPYDTFPFGMGLDYERKFPYYVAEQADRTPADRTQADHTS